MTKTTTTTDTACEALQAIIDGLNAREISIKSAMESMDDVTAPFDIPWSLATARPTRDQIVQVCWELAEVLRARGIAEAKAAQAEEERPAAT